MIKKQFQIFVFITIMAGLLSSCSSISAPTIQPQINNLIATGHYESAAQILQENRKAYGKRDELLYLFDAGMLMHMSHRYAESVQYFEEAKKKYDHLYTISITNQASTWLMNDKRAVYRGEDFERVMVNFFQAVNFMMLGQTEEALVEARNADRMLSLINRQYDEKQQNEYKEDAAARLLMGIIYEAIGAEGIDDAYISYKKSLEAYDSEFYQNSGIEIPTLLKENLLRVAKKIDPEGYRPLKDRFKDIDERNLNNKDFTSEVYLIDYAGFVPIKHEVYLPIPLPNGFFGKLAFPQYDREESAPKPAGYFKAVSDKVEFDAPVETIQDIGYLAVSSLKDRQARVVAKAVVRTAGKFIVEDISENAISEEYGDTAGTIFRYLASLYNIASEEADLRSWQTLPDRINISRLKLKPGSYNLSYQNHDIAPVELKAGEKKVFVYRSADE
jgi:hypothetical protein